MELPKCVSLDNQMLSNNINILNVKAEFANLVFIFLKLFYILRMLINFPTKKCQGHRLLCSLSFANQDRAVARALIGGGLFIYSFSARLISFQINLKITDFKRNPSGITQIDEYTPYQLTL